MRYRSGNELGSEIRQFKQLVKTLHRAGIEVLLDVVYNHTAEGNHLGATLSFKGIDNATYYKLVPGDARYYYDTTGTGNTLNVRSPQVLALIMDSLRYWASEMHVDGFRFDLAAALARELHEVDQLSSFFTLLHQSPDAEPPEAHRRAVGRGRERLPGRQFPRVVDGVERPLPATTFARSGAAIRASSASLGYRLTGSSDLYEASGRPPGASVNLVTAHDGA